MILSNKAQDITYTPDGDMIITPSGDLRRSTMGNLELLCEMIQRRISHSAEEWNSVNFVGANISSYLGDSANEFNGYFIAQVIRNALTEYKLLNTNEIVLTPFVVEKNKITFGINIIIDYNNEKISLVIGYDTRENSFQVKYLDGKKI